MALWAGIGAVAVTATVTIATAQGEPAGPSAPSGFEEAVGQAVGDGFPGAVAYARRGDDEWRTAAGVADKATGERARPEQRFRIASNTKAFVAAVLLQLEGEGRLSLDDSVEKWLPGVVQGNGNDGETITIRQLLNHTSGIHDPTTEASFFAPYLEDGDRDHIITPREVIARSVLHQPECTWWSPARHTRPRESPRLSRLPSARSSSCAHAAPPPTIGLAAARVAPTPAYLTS
ncbi:alkaline D-peptidase [Streptomyces malaysiensis]|uniref:Alkaline D-peptidase n=1 Tax=Streptomyces malaysiensis TaxID=92644 RepID=A0A7X5XCG8_STRMQ|nr:alkaline D-peptidase [Streptomyces malaysiensis]